MFCLHLIEADMLKVLLTSGFSRLAQGTDSICLKQACSKLCVHLTKADGPLGTLGLEGTHAPLF